MIFHNVDCGFVLVGFYAGLITPRKNAGNITHRAPAAPAVENKTVVKARP
jgi:hypothetical protein